MPVDLPCDRRCSIQQSAFLEEDFLASLLVKNVKGKTQKGKAESCGDITGHSLPHKTDDDIKKDGSRHMNGSSIGSLNANNLVGSFLYEQLLNRDCTGNRSFDSHGNLTDGHMNNPCDSVSDSTNTQVEARCSEEWLNKLHLVTLKHDKNLRFSICDEIFQPIELIFIGYLLSSLESPSASSSSSSSSSSIEDDAEADAGVELLSQANQKASSQQTLKQKIAMYNQECVKKVQLTLPVTDTKAHTSTDEVKAPIQLEVIIRHIFLQYPEQAYDAVLVLCEMEQEISFSSKQDSTERNRKKNKHKILRDICLSVVYSLSISDACACSDDLQEQLSSCQLEVVGKQHENEHENENENGNYDKRNEKTYYRIQMQDSLLKVLLHFNDVLGVAQFLIKWNRINDLKVFSGRAWESVRFLIGEEENEEYSPFSSVRNSSTSSSTWRDVPLRRPLPEFENITDLNHCDEFGDDDLDDVNSDEEEEEGDDTHHIDNDNEDNDTGKHLNVTRSVGGSTYVTQSTVQYRHPGALPPSTSKCLRDRLLEASMVDRLCPHTPSIKRSTHDMEKVILRDKITENVKI
jgi:hypothetical protein